MSERHALEILLDAWNEPTQEGRRAIAEAALSASGFVYADPHAPAPFVGIDGMMGFWATFRDRVPGAIMAADGPLQAYHDVAVLPFSLGRDGIPFARGRFVALVDEAARLTRLIGLMETQR